MKNFSNNKWLQTMAHAIMSRQDHIGITTRTHAPVGVCTQRSACVDMREGVLNRTHARGCKKNMNQHGI